MTWEIYVTRSPAPGWTPLDYDVPIRSGSSASIVWLILEIPVFLVSAILVPAVLFILRLPAALVRSRRSKVWSIEAVTWWPREQRLRWSTPRDQHVRVLQEIAAGISEGHIVQPAGAVFHGEAR